MHISKSGTGYQVYVQNSYFKNLDDKADNRTLSETKEIDSYVNAIKDSIPELKGLDFGEISINILPDSSSGMDDSMSTVSDDVIDMTSYQYSYTADATPSGLYFNVSSVRTFDTTAVQRVKDKISQMYQDANALSATEEISWLDAVLSHNGTLTSEDTMRMDLEKMKQENIGTLLGSDASSKRLAYVFSELHKTSDPVEIL